MSNPARNLNSTERGQIRYCAFIAQFGLATVALGAADALADGVSFEDVSREHSTVAARDNLRDYDNRKKYGAERVIDRDRTDYSPLGISAGNYVILPSINVLNHYDDNIFATTNNAKGGWKFELAPSLVFASRLPRHVLDLIINARHVEFSDNEQEAYTDGSLYMRGRLDIDHAQAFFGHAYTGVLHEELGSAEADRDARDPIEHVASRVEAGYIRDAGRLALRVGVKAQTLDYRDVKGFDGENIDQDFRDLTTYAANLKLTYRFSPGYDLATQFRVTNSMNSAGGNLNRDSISYDFLTGMNFEFSPLLRGYLGAGFLHQKFENDNFEDLNETVFRGQLQWLPTQLLTLYLGAERVAAATSFDEASVRLDTIFDGKLEYEIWRNLVFTATGKYKMSDFKGESRNDETLLIGAELEYLVNRNLTMTARYDYRERESSIDEFNYQGSKYMLGLTVKY